MRVTNISMTYNILAATTVVMKGVSSFVIQLPSRIALPTQYSSRRIAASSTAYRQYSNSKIGMTSNNSIDSIIPPTVTPVTLLSGFLGSGKTTTLQHLLENKDGLRIGVIVNDMASVNIDSKLLKKSVSTSNLEKTNDFTNNNGIVELKNGCACCSLADELLNTVETLLDSRDSDEEPFDALVVELSGVADPIAIQQNWEQAKLMNHPVTKKSEMKRIVTLIDSSTFGTDWMTWDTAGERENWVDPMDDCAASRKVPQLLAEQIEAADIMLLNKIDLAGPEQVKIASTLARTINENAMLEEIEFGKVASPKQIVRTDDNETTNKEKEATTTDGASPGCTSKSRNTSTDDLGIVTFVYKADRPFKTHTLMNLLDKWPIPHKEDLGDLVKYEQDGMHENAQPGNDTRESPFSGILRSKGFCWLAPARWSVDSRQGDQWRHDTAMYWSQAGKHFGISAAGKWWATLSKEKMKDYFNDDHKEYERILSEDFVSKQYGDRRQEIVFIGVNINNQEITKALDDCLVTEKDMEQYQQQLDNFMNTVLESPGFESGASFDFENTNQ